jgi:hypothetical protein
MKIQDALVWNTSSTKFLRTRNLQLGGKVQKKVDMLCLSFIEPFVPFRSGALAVSALDNTVPGSGRLIFGGNTVSGKIAVKKYARRVYYLRGSNINWTRARHPLAGPLWFERMKSEYGDEILDAACKVAGCKPERINR